MCFLLLLPLPPTAFSFLQWAKSWEKNGHWPGEVVWPGLSQWHSLRLHLHILLQKLQSSSAVPAASHVIRLEFNHCFKMQSPFYSVRQSLQDTHSHTFTQRFYLVYFIQVKQELGLKTILSPEFMFGGFSSSLSFPCLCAFIGKVNVWLIRWASLY